MFNPPIQISGGVENPPTPPPCLAPLATGAQQEIVISEVLCYMQNTIYHDFVIKTVVDFYSRDAIHDAKSLLFEKCEMTSARFRSYNKDAAKMDSRDIVIKLNEVGCNCPTFVAKEIAKLPLTTLDAFDLAKISKDIDDVLRIKENVINSFTTLTCFQNNFQLVLKQSNKIDKLSENVSSLKLLVEKKQARRVIVSSDSDTDTDTSQSVIDTDYDGDADIDGEDDDDGEDDGVGEDDDDDGEDDKRGSHSIRETVNDRQTVNTKPTTRNREPVLRLTDRPPELKPWMTDGGFNIVGKNGKHYRIKDSAIVFAPMIVFMLTLHCVRGLPNLCLKLCHLLAIRISIVTVDILDQINIVRSLLADLYLLLHHVICHCN